MFTRYSIFIILLTTVYSLSDKPKISHSGPNLVQEDGHSRQRRAYYMGDFPSMLIQSQPPDEWTKKWLVYEHNRYRRMVPASDMNMLYWSEELALSAQRHADRCDFRHRQGKERNIGNGLFFSRDRVNVGENIWAAPYGNYSEAISIWFNEVNDPSCGCNHAYKHCCGHYVQVIWSKSNLVGCGYSRCRDVWGVQGRGHRHVFVCHYNPQGNTVYVTNKGSLYSVPAFTWASGNKGRCSDCGKDSPACFQGLCYNPTPDDPFWKKRN